MLIYLLRHGAVAHSKPRTFLGQADVPLSAEGIRQMEDLSRQLRPMGFGRVVASPLRRARHSARLVSGWSEERIGIVEAFREINLGAWEGLSVAEVQARYPGAYEARGLDLARFRPEGGESFSDVAARAWPALLALAQESGKAAAKEPVLVVAHAGVNRVLLARAAGLPLHELLSIPQPYGALSSLRYSAGKIEIESLP